MITRKLNPEEHYKLTPIAAIAFEYSIDYEKIMSEKGSGDATKNSEEENPNEIYASLADDDETIYGGMIISHHKAHFDGNDIILKGVGGVATLPPYRKMGAIRECFRLLFNEWHERKVPFSYLYPFNVAYYRRFGYELSSASAYWTIDFKSFRPFNVDGVAEFLTPDASHEVLDEIHSKMYQNYNLAVTRNKGNYSYFYDRDTFNTHRYAYVWRNLDGVPKAYILFKKNPQDNGTNNMDATFMFGINNEIAFVDAEGLCGILNFAQTFSSNYDAVTFRIPYDIKLAGILDNSHFTTCKTKYEGMIRVIDVKQVLEICKYNGSGRFNLKITDKFCDWNNRTFCVYFNNGKNVHVIETEDDYDAKMDISTFSALIVGEYNNISECLKPDLTIKNYNPDLDKAFFLKKNYMTELF